jgi:hypothetical protein
VRNEGSEIFRLVACACDGAEAAAALGGPPGLLGERGRRPAAGGRMNGARRELELVRLEPHAAAESALQ